MEDLENCHKIDQRLWAPDTDFSKLRLWNRPEVGDREAYFAYVQQKLRVPEEIQKVFIRSEAGLLEGNEMLRAKE